MKNYHQIKDRSKQNRIGVCWKMGKKDKINEKELLDQKYKLKNKIFLLVVEELKPRITTKSTK